MTATCALLAAVTAGGFLFQLVGLPLPSTLGAMSAAGLLAMAGVDWPSREMNRCLRPTCMAL